MKKVDWWRVVGLGRLGAALEKTCIGWGTNWMSTRSLGLGNGGPCLIQGGEGRGNGPSWLASENGGTTRLASLHERDHPV